MASISLGGFNGPWACLATDCVPSTNNQPVESLIKAIDPALQKISELNLTSAQRKTAEKLTSIFENGTPDFQYGYIEDIQDGAGITCGRVGFTSIELKTLVDRYVQLKGKKTPLAKYTNCLDKSGEAIMKDYRCLFPSVSQKELTSDVFKSKTIAHKDFGSDWSDAAKDPVMKKLQDDYVEATYFKPAIEKTKSYGLHTALAAALVYDSIIQMETSDIDQMAKDAGQVFAKSHSGRTTPISDSEEIEWLKHFQIRRRAVLSRTPSGAGTLYRVDALNQILDSGNTELTPPIHYFDSESKLRVDVPGDSP